MNNLPNSMARGPMQLHRLHWLKAGPVSVNIEINHFVGNILQNKFYACCYVGCAENWNQFIWDHIHLRPRHLRPVYLRPHSHYTFLFETTFWDLFIWDHIQLQMNGHLQNFRSPAKKWNVDHKNRIHSKPNECGLKWKSVMWMWSQMKKCHVNVVSNECDLKWKSLK